jgi:hypothetical protein
LSLPAGSLIITPQGSTDMRFGIAGSSCTVVLRGKNGHTVTTLCSLCTCNLYSVTPDSRQCSAVRPHRWTTNV